MELVVVAFITAATVFSLGAYLGYMVRTGVSVNVEPVIGSSVGNARRRRLAREMRRPRRLPQVMARACGCD